MSAVPVDSRTLAIKLIYPVATPFTSGNTLAKFRSGSSAMDSNIYLGWQDHEVSARPTTVCRATRQIKVRHTSPWFSSTRAHCPALDFCGVAARPPAGSLPSWLGTTDTNR